jgi:predicted nucleotidyltransferase
LLIEQRIAEARRRGRRSLAAMVSPANHYSWSNLIEYKLLVRAVAKIHSAYDRLILFGSIDDPVQFDPYSIVSVDPYNIEAQRLLLDIGYVGFRSCRRQDGEICIEYSRPSERGESSSDQLIRTTFRQPRYPHRENAMPSSTAAYISQGKLHLFGGASSFDMDYLLSKTPHAKDDAIILSGSLVEGSGNSQSDLDVYVIGERKPNVADIDTSRHHWVYTGDDTGTITSSGKEGLLFQIFDYIEPGNLAWDVEYWTFEEVKKLFKDLDRAFADLLRHGYRSTTFGYKAAGFLHRLHHGLVVSDNPTAARLRAELPHSKLCYVLYRQYSSGYPWIRDIRGAWLAEDYNLALYSLSEHLFDQMFAITFLEGLSNPNMKWIFHKLDNMSKDSSVACRSFRTFNEWDGRTQSNRRSQILHGLETLDLIYARGAQLLRNEERFPDVTDGIRVLEEQRSLRCHTHPEMDRQISYLLKRYRTDLPSVVDFVTK